MNREELMKKLELSRVGNGTQTYNDVVVTLTKEETLEQLKYIEHLEKELKQTKLNFRNSQTHSKNCYKKLKEKYTRLERAYKNNEVMTRDLNELINRNLELKDELKRSQETINAWMENHKKLIIDNGKMKKALDIFERQYIHIYYLRRTENVEEYNKMIDKFDEYDLFDYLIEEDYELLKQVFESVGEE